MKDTISVNVEINNVPYDFDDLEHIGEFLVVRRAEDSNLWWYGIYDSRIRAWKIALEIGNGIVLEV